MIELLSGLFNGGTFGTFFTALVIYGWSMETKREGTLMEKMTKKEMIAFLKGMDKRKEYPENEKSRLKGSVETLEEAIQRNTFSKPDDDAGVVSGTFSPDSSIHHAAPRSDTYMLRFSDHESYNEWLKVMSEYSAPVTGVVTEPGDRIVTLSTCTQDLSLRIVVQGKLIYRRERESE